ncbi:hypothetical protein BB561_005905 [Smittium simulii]|uniref:Something about silencing protein 4 domain-containing protein n=1 Tax=Smittium simulii TaxID=133385 RepID=A0A2T9Y7R7_9FUNG|nr:hypothetical protein BB561_005905 [Smittium simulii]
MPYSISTRKHKVSGIVASLDEYSFRFEKLIIVTGPERLLDSVAHVENFKHESIPRPQISFIREPCLADLDLLSSHSEKPSQHPAATPLDKSSRASSRNKPNLSDSSLSPLLCSTQLPDFQNFASNPLKSRAKKSQGSLCENTKATTAPQSEHNHYTSPTTKQDFGLKVPSQATTALLFEAVPLSQIIDAYDAEHSTLHNNIELFNLGPALSTKRRRLANRATTQNSLENTSSVHYEQLHKKFEAIEKKLRIREYEIFEHHRYKQQLFAAEFRELIDSNNFNGSEHLINKSLKSILPALNTNSLVPTPLNTQTENQILHTSTKSRKHTTKPTALPTSNSTPLPDSENTQKNPFTFKNIYNTTVPDKNKPNTTEIAKSKRTAPEFAIYDRLDLKPQSNFTNDKVCSQSDVSAEKNHVNSLLKQSYLKKYTSISAQLQTNQDNQFSDQIKALMKKDLGLRLKIRKFWHQIEYLLPIYNTQKLIIDTNKSTSHHPVLKNNTSSWDPSSAINFVDFRLPVNFKPFRSS